MLTLLLCGLLSPASADVSDRQRHEVAHLLSFVANTDCVIKRNGTLHNGHDALDHINKKYAYFRDEITSTEVFIELTASKSMLSGKDYTVRCGDRIQTTQQWLLDELSAYRRNNN